MSGFLAIRRRPHTAAQWFAARRAGLNPRLERQFKEWLLRDRSHADEYAVCELLWEASTEAARLEPQPPPMAARVPWRLAAAGAIASIIVVASFLWTTAPQAWKTTAGEQRTVLLADGSWVTLNTRTRIDVRLSRTAREVELREGEAFFEVAKDPARPFTVRTPLGFAQAVGTQFNVYLDEDRLRVTTAKGSVLVDGAARENAVLVNAGTQAELRAGDAQAQVTAANLTTVLGWRAQRLDVDDAPLAAVLKDFSRYTPTNIRAASPEIGSLRVSAVLRVGDIAALETTLQGAFGLQLERRGGEIVVVRARGIRDPHS
jgi:transmembrane sensor